jgi:preprotein translocase subunit SecD
MPSQGQLATVSTILSERLAAFGLPNARVSQLVPASQPMVLVEVPHFGGDEPGTLATLLETGNLEFWNTGQQALPEGSRRDPSQFGGTPAFSSKDLDTSQIGISNDQTGGPQVTFEMKGDAIARFATFTKNNIGNYLTLTLDGTVITSAVIESSISGPAVISGHFTRQRATALVSVLKYPPLPVALQISSESPFTS